MNQWSKGQGRIKSIYKGVGWNDLSAELRRRME